VIAEKIYDPLVDLIGHVKLSDFIIALCRNVSNAFEKSRAKTRTYGWTDNMVHTVCRRATTAATVEPVGLNAN